MLQDDRCDVLKLNQVGERQTETDQRHQLTPAVPLALRDAITREGSQWVIVRGNSMRPLWSDGARILIGPARVSSLRCGDLILSLHNEVLVAHRLLRRRRTPAGWEFQTKADSNLTPEPWQPARALVGRVLACETEHRRQELTTVRARWRQRAMGYGHLASAVVYGWAARVTRLRTTGPAPSLDPTISASSKRLRWARNLVLQQRLAACVRDLRRIGCEPLVLKGQALILIGDADPSVREMADLDLLIPEARAPEALAHLASCGYRPHGRASQLRGALDDQVLLEDAHGVLIDLHWRITGGWRYRDALRLDHASLWTRSRAVALPDGDSVRILGLEDQWLHLCLHLGLDGFTSLKRWRDVRDVVQAHGHQMKWPLVIEQARRWRVASIVWLVTDTLWQAWRIQVPVPLLEALRPRAWRRVWLRRLLPRSVESAVDESRLRRHLREWLLMDRLADRARLAWRWMHPPAAWFRFQQLREAALSR